MLDPTLRADCANCAALCCVSLAFDRSEWFAFDKAAGVACRHLASKHRCAIHSELQREGFSGCIRYDCLGAGQHVVQQLFAGRSWRDDPALLQPMSEAFRVMRQVHEWLLLLRAAREFSRDPGQERRRQALEHDLCPPQGWSLESLAEFERGKTPADIQSFLSTLKGDAQAVQDARTMRPS